MNKNDSDVAFFGAIESLCNSTIIFYRNPELTRIDLGRLFYAEHSLMMFVDNPKLVDVVFGTPESLELKTRQYYYQRKISMYSNNNPRLSWQSYESMREMCNGLCELWEGCVDFKQGLDTMISARHEAHVFDIGDYDRDPMAYYDYDYWLVAGRPEPVEVERSASRRLAESNFIVACVLLVRFFLNTTAQ
ncbi:unnamed protein product [Caenorhabditis bovis]|uniref:Uncharacterized protein n=1 Tax=Caenorhabditis bovis TaxID=2654633 RepID=A0A8S1EI72_9PELO|nr:unnamed protein product [Caenorhabditis bovis]